MNGDRARSDRPRTKTNGVRPWLAAIVLLGAPAVASAVGPEHFAVTLTLTSDYVFRGISQSDGGPAIQGGVGFEHENGLFAGVWASTVDYPTDDREVEVDLHIGWGIDFGAEWGVATRLTRYEYLGARDDGYEYLELDLALRYRDRLALSVGFTDDALGFDRDAWIYELTGRLPLRRGFAASVGVGYFDLTDLVDDGYSYWNLNLSRTFRRWTVDLGWFDSSRLARYLWDDRADGRVVASVSFRVH